MAEAILEQRVLNLEEMMADLIRTMHLSQERIEANLEALRVEWRAEARQMNRQYGELANKMGTLVEDLVAPSMPRLLREVVICPEDEGISMAVRVRRAHPIQKGLMQEFDAIASCGRYALFNETKNSLAPTDIDTLVAKLTSARDFFPEYEHHKLIGVVATLYMDISVVRYATRQGILALAIGDELMNIVNEPGFQLREF
jgi:hypothetical protein